MNKNQSTNLEYRDPPHGYHILKQAVENGVFYDEEISLIEELIVYMHGGKTVKTSYEAFLDEFNNLTGNKYLADTKTFLLFEEQRKHYSLPQILKALRNIVKVEWYVENLNALTPEHFLATEGKTNKIAQYQVFVEKSKEDKPKKSSNNDTARESNYGEIADL